MSSPSSNPSSSSSSSTSPPPHSSHSPLPSLTNNPLRPPSQPSSSTQHPLLAPLGHRTSSAPIPHHPTPPATPEKCLTFCSQRHDAPPLCRMLCLRRRQPQLSRAEHVARLRPPRRTAPLPTEDRGPAYLGMSSSFSFTPFDSLRRTLEPYSFVYVRGTPDGVVGRYMEEMESDDGQYDFGSLSRNAGHLQRRKRDEGGMEFLDWGEHGSMAYLPLTSIFHPILSIPTTINRIFSPTLNFLNRYRDSFTDGSQTRALEKFREEVDKGGAVAVLGKVRGHWEKKVQRQKEQIEKQKELREMEAKAGAGFEGTPSGKNVSVGTPTLRERFEAKARDLERQREMERDRVKKVGKEVEGKGE